MNLVLNSSSPQWKDPSAVNDTLNLHLQHLGIKALPLNGLGYHFLGLLAIGLILEDDETTVPHSPNQSTVNSLPATSNPLKTITDVRGSAPFPQLQSKRIKVKRFSWPK